MDIHTLSSTHHFRDGCWATDYVGGRSKLSLDKAGTRPWKAHRVCMCPDGKHADITSLLLDKKGYPLNLDEIPNFCSLCPVLAGEIMKERQGDNFKCYRNHLISTTGMSLVIQPHKD